MRITVIAAASLYALAAAGFVHAQEQDAPAADAITDDELLEARREAAVAYMEGVVEPTAEALWNSVGYIIDQEGEHNLSPQNDAEWDAARDKALAVVELAEGLKTVPFAWPEQDWIDHAETVVEAARLSVVAAEHHSEEEMFSAGQVLDEACESCHLQYDPDSAAPPSAL